MKILYFGGQKSGKSSLAEQKALELAKSDKPIYLATYDNSFEDEQMQERIKRHKTLRQNRFTTIESPRKLAAHIKAGGVYLIDCISMWLLNTIEESEESIMEEINALSKTNADIIFVLNDVNSGIIPINSLSRRYVDRSGIVGQKLAAICDEVYEVKLGLERRLK